MASKVTSRVDTPRVAASGAAPSTIRKPMAGSVSDSDDDGTLALEHADPSLADTPPLSDDDTRDADLDDQNPADADEDYGLEAGDEGEGEGEGEYEYEYEGEYADELDLAALLNERDAENATLRAENAALQQRLEAVCFVVEEERAAAEADRAEDRAALVAQFDAFHKEQLDAQRAAFEMHLREQLANAANVLQKENLLLRKALDKAEAALEASTGEHEQFIAKTNEVMSGLKAEAAATAARSKEQQKELAQIDAQREEVTRLFDAANAHNATLQKLLADERDLCVTLREEKAAACKENLVLRKELDALGAAQSDLRAENFALRKELEALSAAYAELRSAHTEAPRAAGAQAPPPRAQTTTRVAPRAAAVAQAPPSRAAAVARAPPSEADDLRFAMELQAEEDRKAAIEQSARPTTRVSGAPAPARAESRARVEAARPTTRVAGASAPARAESRAPARTESRAPARAESQAPTSVEAHPWAQAPALPSAQPWAQASTRPKRNIRDDPNF